MRITFAEEHGDWARDYDTEQLRLRQVLEGYLVQIEHIGSTSVPGLAAKPIVDIQVGVKSLEEFVDGSGIAALEAAGYTYLPEFEKMAPFRRLFVREQDGVRLNNLHLVAADHPWFRRHLIFRDYLRRTPQARARYEAVKRELARQDWKEMSDYAAAKTAVVLAIEDEALEFFGFEEEFCAWIRTSRV